MWSAYMRIYRPNKKSTPSPQPLSRRNRYSTNPLSLGQWGRCWQRVIILETRHPSKVFRELSEDRYTTEFKNKYHALIPVQKSINLINYVPDLSANVGCDTRFVFFVYVWDQEKIAQSSWPLSWLPTLLPALVRCGKCCHRVGIFGTRSFSNQ